MRLRYFFLNTHNSLLSSNGRMSLFIGMAVLSAKSCFPPFNHWLAPLSLPRRAPEQHLAGWGSRSGAHRPEELSTPAGLPRGWLSLQCLFPTA